MENQQFSWLHMCLIHKLTCPHLIMSKSNTTTIFTTFATTCLYGDRVVSSENKMVGLVKIQLTSHHVANLWQSCENSGGTRLTW